MAKKSMTQDKIIDLDNKWRSETKSDSSPFIDTRVSSNASGYLRAVKKNTRLFTEIFVMNNKGMNVVQSDEAKWQKTFSEGASAIHIGKIKKEDSTQQLQTQVSMTIVDPSTSKVIVAINVDNL